MVSAKLKQKEGCLFAYEISDGKASSLAYVTKEMQIFIDSNCAYKDLAMRAVINKLKNSYSGTVSCKPSKGQDLESFGFLPQGAVFAADIEKLSLDGCCGKCRGEGEKCD